MHLINYYHVEDSGSSIQGLTISEVLESLVSRAMPSCVNTYSWSRRQSTLAYVINSSQVNHQISVHTNALPDFYKLLSSDSHLSRKICWCRLRPFFSLSRSTFGTSRNFLSVSRYGAFFLLLWKSLLTGSHLVGIRFTIFQTALRPTKQTQRYFSPRMHHSHPTSSLVKTLPQVISKPPNHLSQSSTSVPNIASLLVEALPKLDTLVSRSDRTSSDGSASTSHSRRGIVSEIFSYEKKHDQEYETDQSNDRDHRVDDFEDHDSQFQESEVFQGHEHGPCYEGTDDQVDDVHGLHVFHDDGLGALLLDSSVASQILVVVVDSDLQRRWVVISSFPAADAACLKKYTLRGYCLMSSSFRR